MDIRIVITIALLAWAGGVQPAMAQTAKARYDQALARERDLRKSASTPAVRTARQIIRSYEEIALRYPTSGYTDDALWRAGRLAADAYDWHGERVDQQTSQRLLRWLIREYPHSSHNQPAAEALADLITDKLAPSRPAPAAARSTPRPSPSAPSAKPATPRLASTAPTPAPATASPAPVKSAPSGPATIRAVTRTLLDGVERVTIELDNEVRYDAQTLEGPARLFFDLQSTSASKDLLDARQAFDSDLVREIRLGRRDNGITRLVLELTRQAQYSVFMLYSPYRLVVDFPRAATRFAAAAPVTPAPPLSPVGLDVEIPRAVLDAEGVLVVATEPDRAAPSLVETLPSVEGTSVLTASMPTVAMAPPAFVEPTASAVTADAGTAPSAPLPGTVTVRPPTPPPAPVSKPTGPAPMPPASNSLGGFSLARQLGLGVARIVIDPGHGGHDPGAIGGGLTESSIVLDIALRLEKLLQDDGNFDVVMTRRTDTYVALEERTAMANREDADLFLSIHVNSSRNQAARGIETYYLNFASDKAAEAVAARENSASGQTMRNLTGIVQAIALNNKLDESRDFAATVQKSMVRRGQQHSKLTRDLGVKRAPFVVLIGAGMPSVLAEVAFISNTQERQLLKSATYKQRLAQALFDAIQQYQRSLKVVTVAQQ